MSGLILFGSRGCPFAHRTRLLLAFKEVPFDHVEVDAHAKSSGGTRTKEFSQIPLLEHEGERFVESNVINEYLDEVFPDPPAMPRGPGERATARIWIEFANACLAPAYASLLQCFTEGERSSAAKKLLDVLWRLEKEALQGRPQTPYWLGDSPSLVDFAFYPWFERMAATLSLFALTIPREASRLSAWCDTMAALPAARAVASPAEFYVERYQRFAASRH